MYVYIADEVLDTSLVEKVPDKLRELFKREKDKYHYKKIDLYTPISEQGLKDETLAIIAFLNLKYWCEDEEERARLEKIYEENENKSK